MWSLGLFFKRPTRAEYTVIVFALSSALILLGGIGLVAAFRAPAEEHEAAMALYLYSGCSLGLGLALLLAFCGYRRLVD